MRAFVLMLALMIAGAAAGQTQEQQDRLDRVARFVVTAPVCERLGMRIDALLPKKVEDAITAEAAAWQVDPALIKRLKGEAIARQSAILETDLNASASGARSNAQLRNLRAVVMDYGRTCMAATTDPIFSNLIVVPPGFELNAAVTAYMDSMLEMGGLASWQTPRVQARGDLLMLAGICRSRIGAARSDEIKRQYGASAILRERNYFLQAFDMGLAEQATIATLAGCNRAIERVRAKEGSIQAK